MSQDVYSPALKRVVTLTSLIGSGGEGDVYSWPADTSKVCKVYNASTLRNRGEILARKLTAMIPAPPEDPMAKRGTPTFTWPQQTVCNATDRRTIVGFVMPSVRGVQEIHHLYSAKDRKRMQFKYPEYQVMVQTARNLAEAFELLHRHGYVMGDVNEKNICFRPNATVAFFDNDLFQVTDPTTREVYQSPVGRFEYWPADSIRLKEQAKPLGPEHDRFALSIFLFRLLMDGAHPFHGMAQAGKDPLSWEAQIAAGRFMFDARSNDGYAPPPSVLPYSGLPSGLQDLFYRSLALGSREASVRPAAGAWVSELDRLLPSLKPCGKGHVYFGEVSQCPWCALAASRATCPQCGHRYYGSPSSCPKCTASAHRAVSSTGTSRVSSTTATSGPVRVPPPPPPRPAPVATPTPPVVPATAWWRRIAQVPKIIIAIVCLVILWGTSSFFFGHSGNGTQSSSSEQISVSQGTDLPVKRNQKDNAEMIHIPAGDFLMGDSDQNDNPRRRVHVAGYWIYKNLVTVGMYRKFCNATNRPMPSAPSFDPNWQQDDHPMVDVTWDDTQAYCKWAGVSLPKEAEWEKAARGTDGQKFPWVGDWDASKCANSVGSSRSGTASVGSYPQGASPYGVLDMAGNAWQWCDDWHDNSSTQRVLRGGSWSTNDPDRFRCAFRLSYGPGSRFDNDGFRGVLRSDTK